LHKGPSKRWSDRPPSRLSTDPDLCLPPITLLKIRFMQKDTIMIVFACHRGAWQ
jgi:hypothetical protein